MNWLNNSRQITAFLILSLLAAVVAPAAATAGPAQSGEDDATAFLPHCEGVIGFIDVPDDKIDALLPDTYTRDATGIVAFHAESCRDVQAPEGEPIGDALWSQVRIPLSALDPPEQRDPDDVELDAYGLTWSTDNPEFFVWSKTGAGQALHDYVFMSPEMAFSFAPDQTSSVGSLTFDSPKPSEWAFKIEALVARRPDVQPGTPLEVNVWHDTTTGTSRFFANLEELVLGPFVGTLTTAPGTKLADLLAGSSACNVDGTRCSLDGDDDNFIIARSERLTTEKP